MELQIIFSKEAADFFCRDIHSGQQLAQKIEGIVANEFPQFRQTPLLDISEPVSDYPMTQEDELRYLGECVAFAGTLSQAATTAFEENTSQMSEFCGLLETALIDDINASGIAARIEFGDIDVSLHSLDL